MFINLRSLNPQLNLFSIEDPEFQRYGQVITGYDFKF